MIAIWQQIAGTATIAIGETTQANNNNMYKCLNKKSFEDIEGYQLTSIRLEDKELIRLWRNAQIAVLRQKSPLTKEEQEKYFQTQIGPSFDEAQPQQILFSFFFNGQLIGYGGLVHIDWEARRAEVSFLVDPERAFNQAYVQKDFYHYLQLLCEIAFSELKLNRLCTETFDFRHDHIEVMEKIGFCREGTLRQHVCKKGRLHDSLLHGLLKYEYLKNK